MENDKIIIILLVIVMALLIAAFMLFGPFAGKDVQMNVITADTLSDGDNFGISLKSSDGTPVANAVVNVTIIDGSGGENHQVITTDANGEGYLPMNGLTPGKYNMELSYSGGNGFKTNSTSHVIEMQASTTSVAGGGSQSSSGKTVSLTLNSFDEYATQYVGEYKVQAMKWNGAAFGFFGVWVYKNGQMLDRSSYLSRAYMYKDGQWQWSDWDDGNDGATYHKYGVSKGIEIQTVEVKIL